MDHARSKNRKGFTIETAAFPVRHCAMQGVGSDTHAAIVRIRRADRTIADGHLPRYARRRASRGEAHREAIEYAIRAINAGCAGDPAASVRVLA